MDLLTCSIRGQSTTNAVWQIGKADLQCVEAICSHEKWGQGCLHAIVIHVKDGIGDEH